MDIGPCRGVEVRPCRRGISRSTLRSSLIALRQSRWCSTSAQGQDVKPSSRKALKNWAVTGLWHALGHAMALDLYLHPPFLCTGCAKSVEIFTKCWNRRGFVGKRFSYAVLVEIACPM